MENWRGLLEGGIPKLWAVTHNGQPEFGDEQPLRSELFSTDQLEQHAKALAGWHEVDKRPGRTVCLSRLEKNEDGSARSPSTDRGRGGGQSANVAG